MLTLEEAFWKLCGRLSSATLEQKEWSLSARSIEGDMRGRFILFIFEHVVPKYMGEVFFLRARRDELKKLIDYIEK